MSANVVQKATGASPAGLTDSLILDDGTNVGVGTTSPAARLHVVKTTEQLRLGYDASNYLMATISSGGSATFNTVIPSAACLWADVTSPLSAANPEGTPTATPVDFGVRMSRPLVDHGRTFCRSLVVTEVNDPVDFRLRSVLTGLQIPAGGLTRSGSTATVNLGVGVAHGLTTGDEVFIRDADQTEYNGPNGNGQDGSAVVEVTVTGSNTFTY